DNVQRGSGGGSSQIFMIFDPEQLGGRDACDNIVEGIQSHLAATTPAEPGSPVRWPGESTSRQRYGEEPVVIDDMLWRSVCELAG
ncbi:MAG: 3-dehydro-L-gulonate 2-dehydrogenase, partial [Halomonas sp.]